MRRRGIRVFLLVAVILGLAIATLSYKQWEVSIFGADIGASGDGPLGLQLGLDLQGGSHLMYKADLPDEIDLAFEREDVEISEIQDLLQEQGQSRATLATRQFDISDLAFEQVARQEIRDSLTRLGPVLAFGTGDSGVEVTFAAAVEQPALEQVLEGLGHQGAAVVSSGDREFTIGELSLVEVAQGRLRDAFEVGLAPLEAFSSGDGVLSVAFRESLEESEVSGVLQEEGYEESTIVVPGQSRYHIQGLALDDAGLEELRSALERDISPFQTDGFVATINDPTRDQMKGVQDTIRRRVNALGTTDPIIQRFGEDQIVIQLPGLGESSVDVTFRTANLMTLEVAATLSNLGVPSPGVQVTGENTRSLVFTEPLGQVEKDAVAEAVETFPEGVTVEFVNDDREIALTFPEAPNQASIGNLLSEIGIVDFTVRSQSAEGRFLIRTERPLTTVAQDDIEMALEGRLAEVSTFEVSGGIERAKRLIGDTAQLVFRERECLPTLQELQAVPGLCEPVERGGAGQFVERDLGLTGEDLARAFPGRDPTTRAHEVDLEFKGRGVDIWSDVTRRLVGDSTQRIAIYLDDVQLTAPVVSGHSPDGRTRITGGFTRQEAQDLAAQLESGRLPVPLTLIREGTVDALLGADSLRKSLIAGLVGLGLVLGFMLVYYRAAGLVAATALMVYAVIVLAILKLVPVTLNLSGIAGLVLSIGMAVDANILIFERMKEEMRTGRTLSSAVEVGFRRAWVAIRDSNLSTIGTCAVLFLFGSRLGGGTPVVTGLAVTLLIGVLVSMFTAFMLSRYMLQILAITPMGRRVSLFTPEARIQAVGVAGGGH